jgi:hypothetical protein
VTRTSDGVTRTSGRVDDDEDEDEDEMTMGDL